jgi:capsular polysaccharide transport system permease protein
MASTMTDAKAPARLATLVKGAVAQATVIRSLVLRELQQRYGRNNIGYLWVIAEPMMLASVVTLFHTIISPHGDGGMSPYTFMLTGYSIFIIFRNTFNRAESILHQSEPLFYHGMIAPIDLVFALMLVDMLGCVSALFFLQTFGIMLGIAELPFRPLYLLGAVVLFTWWSTGMALLSAAYSYGSPLIGRLVHPTSYFSLPLSGAFMTVSFLPAWTRPYMAWNPMMSVFEMARYGQFEKASSSYFHIGFVIAASTFITYWGLLAIRQVRKHIHVP